MLVGRGISRLGCLVAGLRLGWCLGIQGKGEAEVCESAIVDHDNYCQYFGGPVWYRGGFGRLWDGRGGDFCVELRQSFFSRFPRRVGRASNAPLLYLW